MSQNLNQSTNFIDNSVAVIKLKKSVLGGNDAFEFTETLHNLITKKINRVVLDLADVEIINSSGIGMIISGHSTLTKKNINMYLLHVPAKVKELLAMTHLDKVLIIISDINEAK